MKSPFYTENPFLPKKHLQNLIGPYFFLFPFDFTKFSPTFSLFKLLMPDYLYLVKLEFKLSNFLKLLKQPILTKGFKSLN